MRTLVVIAALAASARAAPGPITIQIKGGTVWDLATQLSTATGCRFIAMANAPVDLAVTKLSLWEILGRLETQSNLYARLNHGTYILEAAQPNQRPSWSSDWRSLGQWAITFVPGQGFGARGATTPGVYARLLLIGLEGYTIDKVVIERAVADTRTVTVAATPPPRSQACETSEIELVIAAPMSAKQISLRGYVVLDKPSAIVKRVEVPLNDDVVDIAQGRLRVHVASRSHGNGLREVHVGWDTMGDARAPTQVDVVDEQGKSMPTQGSGSGGSSTGQGHQDRVVTWTTGKVFALITIPSGPSTTEKIPFRFDNESLSPRP